jgi:hypothetical protein
MDTSDMKMYTQHFWLILFYVFKYVENAFQIKEAVKS